MSWAVATCLGWAAVLSITLPRMLHAMTATGVFCFYAYVSSLPSPIYHFPAPNHMAFNLSA